MIRTTLISSLALLLAVQNGRYQHPATGISFALPADWSVVKEGETVVLQDSVTHFEAAVWMRAEKHPTTQIQKLLLAALDAKAASRTSFTGYQIRADSIQTRVIGGQQALSAVADYTRNGRPMNEYLTWIFSAKNHALFFGRVPPAKLDAFRARLDIVINSAIVP
jgi:hypothetical protein